jgi:DNA-binding IscR family transcriptional regulator
VGDVIRFVQGPLIPVDCIAAGGKERCPLYGDCVFLPMWERVQKAMSDVYDTTSFQDLVDQEASRRESYTPSYAI